MYMHIYIHMYIYGTTSFRTSATHRNTLQRNIYLFVPIYMYIWICIYSTTSFTTSATHCNTFQKTAIHCRWMQHG